MTTKKEGGFNGRLNLRLSVEDHAAIKTKADGAGLSLSDYMRRMALAGRVNVIHATADIELTKELNRIGVNLNQGIKKLNETGRRSDDLAESLVQLNAILARLEMLQ